MKELHIIAACADRKSLTPEAALRMRSLRNKTIDARIREWTQRVRESTSMRVAAEDLYIGEYWSVVRTLPAIAQAAGFTTTLWVASAGYGLVRSTAHVHSYAGTFTSDHVDTVAVGDDPRTAAREWWAQLTKARLVGQHTSDIATIARKNPNAHFVIIGSPTYISALHDDIFAAMKELKGPSQLIIITSPNGPLPALAANTLYATAHYQAPLGGTLLSLHARVARELLQRSLDLTAVRRSLAQRQEDPRRHDRTKMTDEEVRLFVTKSSARTHTTALRELRDAGYACEQSRFRRLFLATRQG